MSITVQHRKEALGQAYLRAVVAMAGYNLGKSEFDYCFDGTIKDVVTRDGRYYENGIGINFQLKSSSDVFFQNGNVVYDLECKNYNDLVPESTMLPKILVLFVLPTDESDWLNVSTQCLTMKRCAWWCSLEGLPATKIYSQKESTYPIVRYFHPKP